MGKARSNARPENLYTQVHLSDHRVDVLGLSAEQRGIYESMRMVYIQTGEPLPSDVNSLYRLTAATTASEKRAVREVVKEKFEEVDGVLKNARCDEELQRIAVRRTAAARAANVRHHGEESAEHASAMRTHLQTHCDERCVDACDDAANHKTKNQEPQTNKHKNNKPDNQEPSKPANYKTKNNPISHTEDDIDPTHCKATGASKTLPERDAHIAGDSENTERDKHASNSPLQPLPSISSTPFDWATSPPNSSAPTPSPFPNWGCGEAQTEADGAVECEGTVVSTNKFFVEGEGMVYNFKTDEGIWYRVKSNPRVKEGDVVSFESRTGARGMEASNVHVIRGAYVPPKPFREYQEF